MRRGETLSRRATTALGLTAAVSLVLVIRLRLSAPLGVEGIGLYAFVARCAFIGSSLVLCASWAHARGYRVLDRLGYARLVSSRAASDGVLPDRTGPPGATWNGSRWVEEARSPGTRGLFGVGGGGYQGAESAEETRRREAREFAEAEHWARVEREDEAREEARAPGGSREEKAREKKERKRENAKAKTKASKAKEESPASSDAKWADFDERWAALESEDASSAYPTLTYERVPWPPRMAETLRRAAKGATKEDVKTWKAAYRASLMRWHPDKFAARHARRLHEDDRERILTRVNAVARAITAAFAKG